jgi:hypothetical protein
MELYLYWVELAAVQHRTQLEVQKLKPLIIATFYVSPPLSYLNE